MNREQIAAAVAAHHGWESFGAGEEINAYVAVAELALEREFHLAGCAELLDYYGMGT